MLRCSLPFLVLISYYLTADMVACMSSAEITGLMPNVKTEFES